MNMSITFPGRAVINNESLNIVSHTLTSITVQPLIMKLIEVEDTLFHLDSAVMLPSNPKGASSNQGSGGNAEQKAVSGLAILALLFRELELYPARKFIIAAHTDTSGDDAMNFKLSELRAGNVLHLLDGNMSEWAKISADRHRIEDYQQIMQFFAARKGWNCDLIDIDNKWGDKTEYATKQFLDKTMGSAADDTLLRIKNDPQKKWPEELWQKVFDLYMEQLDLELQETPDRRSKRQLAVSSHFADASKPYLACGESYPIDQKEKNNYRSQTNRRVELLMFDGNDVPTLTCQADTTKKHDIAKCPVWNKVYIKPEYIDPQDINAVMYYLQFVYYDRIKKDLLFVPKGLVFQAYENSASILQAFTEYSNNTYAVKVRFKNKIKDPARTKFYFEFTTDNQWIYTKDASATPLIVTKTAAEIETLSPEEQWKYQPLPKRWCSHEYWTRFQGNGGGAVTFTDIKDGTDSGAYGKQVFTQAALRPSISGMPDLKPFGDDVLSESKPIVYSLDDCILTDSAFNPMTVVADDAALLDKEFSVINPDTSAKREYLTTGGLSSNHIPFRYYSGKVLQAIVYKNRIFCIFQDRVDKNDFAGQRAAVFNHASNTIMINGFQQRHYRDYHNIGNFDAYLFRNIDFVNNESVSYIINYFRWHFEDEASGNPSPQIWINETCKNIADEWNNAVNSQLPALSGVDGAKKYRIFIRYFLQHVPKPFQHTLVKVLPAGTKGRSHMGTADAEIRADDNKRNPSTGEFTAAHEFGHAASLDDNYHERWSYCCYLQRSFVDFKPGAPFDYDKDAMMHHGIVIRSRDYWQFAEWMYKEFDSTKTVKFLVNRKNDPDYEIPYNAANTGDPRITANESKSYYNYPDKLERLRNNSKSGKGKFDCHVYPLGKDPYSEGLLASKEKFTGLVVLTVNLRFQFWDSADYDDIIKCLSSIELSINENLLNSLNLKITGNAPYTNACIKIQPRYLVNNFTDGYIDLDDKLDKKAKYDARITWITGKPEAVTHYTINVVAPFLGTIFSNSKWTGTDTLELVKGDKNKFWKYFSEMIGLENGKKPSASNFELSGLIPGGTIQSY